MYQSFDNVDGKQARRTGSSSPLGELFDHGIDSLNCTLGGVVLAACLGFGPTRQGAVVVLVSAWPMYISSWEQFHTGTLYLGYFNGPTEGILIAVLCMLVSAVCGPFVWHGTLHDITGLPAWLVGTTIRTDTLFTSTIFFALFGVHVPGCLWNVYKSRRKAQREATQHHQQQQRQQRQQESRLTAAWHTALLTRQWTPLLIFTAAAWTWLTASPSRIIQHDHPHLHDTGTGTGIGTGNHLVLFSALICLVFGRVTTKIILAHLLHQPFPLFAGILVPLIAGSVAVNWPAITGLSAIITTEAREVAMLWMLTGVAGVMYSRWAVGVIRDFTTYLNINCLSIPYKKTK